MENKYVSVSEYAKMHKMDVGYIRKIIAQGRIPAIKIGNQWAIPAETPKPEDKRVKSGKYINWRKNKTDE